MKISSLGNESLSIGKPLILCVKIKDETAASAMIISVVACVALGFMVRLSIDFHCLSVVVRLLFDRFATVFATRNEDSSLFCYCFATDWVYFDD